MTKLLLSILFTNFVLCISAQNSTVILINSRKIDSTRYNEVNGDPYLFKTWQLGKVVNANAMAVDSVLMNYNGFTHSFEVRQHDHYIELEPAFYPLIIIYADVGEDVFYKRNDNSQLKNRYSRLLYQGENVDVELNFSTSKKETKVNYGGIPDRVSFVRKYWYYLRDDKALHRFKLNKKSFLRATGNNERVKSYMKKEKLSLKDEEELLQVLAFYDDLVSH